MTNKLDWNELTLPGLSPEETLKKLYLTDKLSIRDLAAKLGVNQKPLMNKLKEFNIPSRPAHRRAIHKEAIVSFLNKNPDVKKPAKIARGAGVPYSIVMYYKHLITEEKV